MTDQQFVSTTGRILWQGYCSRVESLCNTNGGIGSDIRYELVNIVSCIVSSKHGLLPMSFWEYGACEQQVREHCEALRL